MKSGDGEDGWLQRWWPPRWRKFLGQGPPAPFLGLNIKKAFTAAEPSLSRFHGHESLPDARELLSHSRSPTPTSEEELRAGGGGGRRPAG